MTAQTPNVDPDSTIRLDAQSAFALAAGDRLGTQRGDELRPLLSSLTRKLERQVAKASLRQLLV
jgi:hypothetical protein